MLEKKKSSSFLFFFLIFFRADVNDVLSIRFLGCFNEDRWKVQTFGGPVLLQVLKTITIFVNILEKNVKV